MRARLVFLLLSAVSAVGGIDAIEPLHAANYSNLFKATNPAVAVLYTSGRVANPASEFGEAVANGLGSGFLVDDEGHVMTAAHVVQTADLVRVEFSNGFRTTAAIIASDPVKDVALLKLDEMPEGVSPLKTGQLRQGRDWRGGVRHWRALRTQPYADSWPHFGASRE